MSNGSEQWRLARVSRKRETRPTENSAPKLPAIKRGIALVGIGNSGEAVVSEMRRLGLENGYDLIAMGLNNDLNAPSPFAIANAAGEEHKVTFDPNRLIIGADGNPRDQIKEYSLLRQRYLEKGLLRGIPVFETYNRGGRGGHSFPVITAMDIDRQIDEIYGFLRRMFAPVRGDRATGGNATGIEDILLEDEAQQRVASESWIVLVIGGGTGSCGNAGHQLLPYLIRYLLTEQGIYNYELWGVVLGPRAFTGLTAHINHNYVQLLEALNQMATYGQRRSYMNGIAIHTDAPPYDRLFLMDDPALPRESASVSEAELNAFLRRTARSLHLLLTTTAYDVVASHTANPAALAAEPERGIRWLHTVNGATAGADLRQLQELVAAKIEAQLLGRMVERFSV